MRPFSVDYFIEISLIIISIYIYYTKLYDRRPHGLFINLKAFQHYSSLNCVTFPAFAAPFCSGAFPLSLAPISVYYYIFNLLQRPCVAKTNRHSSRRFFGLYLAPCAVCRREANPQTMRATRQPEHTVSLDPLRG